jgi:hypothetical protein
MAPMMGSVRPSEAWSLEADGDVVAAAPSGPAELDELVEPAGDTRRRRAAKDDQSDGAPSIRYGSSAAVASNGRLDDR